MKLVNDIMKMVKNLCNNDETCIMLTFIVVGFLLCYLFKDQISGFANFSSLGDELSKGTGALGDELTDVVKEPDQKPKLDTPPKQIGIELKKKTPDPTLSTGKQLAAMAAKPQVTDSPIGAQVPGLKVQESMMFRPFDEIWNPGFMPLDMVFKDVVQAPKVGPISAPSSDVSNTKDLKFILVYAPWCGHSKKMLPGYEKVKSEFNGQIINGKKVSILMYNSDVDKDKVKEYGVKGFPTLFVEKNGVRESFPHRSYEKISEYINNA